MIFPIKVGLEPYGRSLYTCNLVYWIGRRAHRRRPLVKLHPYPDSHPTALKLGPPFNRRLLLPRIFDHLAFRHFRSNFATSGKENNLPDLFRSGAAVVVVVDVVVTFVVFLSFGFFSREMMKEMILLVKSQSVSQSARHVSIFRILFSSSSALFCTSFLFIQMKKPRIWMLLVLNRGFACAADSPLRDPLTHKLWSTLWTEPKWERERERNVCVEETEEDERKRERALLLPDMLAEEILWVREC